MRGMLHCSKRITPPMSLFELLSLVITLIAVLGYVNHRFVHLPETVGITGLALLMSMGVTGYGLLNPDGAPWARGALASVNFSEVVFHGILGLLLFAGSLSLQLSSMNREKGTILVLATVGVLISTVVVGAGALNASMLTSPRVRRNSASSSSTAWSVSLRMPAHSTMVPEPVNCPAPA